MNRKTIFIGASLTVAAALGTFAALPPVWAHGGGGGGGASGGSSGGEGGVSVTFSFSPAIRSAPGKSREIYVVQEDGAFKDVMMLMVTYDDGGVMKMFMPSKRMTGVYTALREFHHPDAFNYIFTGKTMEGKDVAAEFSVSADWIEGEVEFSGAGVNGLALDEVHVVYRSDPDELEWDAGGPFPTVVWKISVRDGNENPVTGAAASVFVIVADRILKAGGTYLVLPTTETAVGTYETAGTFFGGGGLPDGEYDISIWVDFNGDGTEEDEELFTVTVEAEEE